MKSLGLFPNKRFVQKWMRSFTDSQTDEKGKLETILSSWVGHNTQDGEKFRRWTKEAQEMKDTALYNTLVEATQEIEDAKEKGCRGLKEPR